MRVVHANSLDGVISTLVVVVLLAGNTPVSVVEVWVKVKVCVVSVASGDIPLIIRLHSVK
jgi:hypothetical protein